MYLLDLHCHSPTWMGWLQFDSQLSLMGLSLSHPGWDQICMLLFLLPKYGWETSLGPWMPSPVSTWNKVGCTHQCCRCTKSSRDPVLMHGRDTHWCCDPILMETRRFNTKHQCTVELFQPRTIPNCHHHKCTCVGSLHSYLAQCRGKSHKECADTH